MEKKPLRLYDPKDPEVQEINQLAREFFRNLALGKPLEELKETSEKIKALAEKAAAENRQADKF